MRYRNEKLHKNHPFFFYFTLVILISWSGVAMVGGAHRLVTPDPTDEQMPLLILVMCAGPTITGILSIWLCE